MVNLGRETHVTIDGKTWIVGRVELSVLEEFRDWVREQVGDPFDHVERLAKILPPAEVVAMAKEAQDIRNQLASFTLGCPIATRFLNTEFGMARLFLAMLKTNHPQATLNDAFRVLQVLGAEKAAKAISDGTGNLPEGKASAPAA